MRVFVTGATGFVGSAIVKELLGAGHTVLGLARTDAAATQLLAAGAEAHRGNLDDLESLRQGAADCDAVIHTGFNHNFATFKANCEDDRKVIDAMGSALAGTTRPLIVTSGIGVLSNNRPVTEDDTPPPADVIPRAATEEACAAAAAMGVNVYIVRLPPTVHGKGDHGFVPMIMDMAKEKGESAYIGDGQNVWPAVHRFDAAVLYRLIAEQQPAQKVFHAVAEGGIAFKDIATAIGNGLQLPAVSKNGDAAQAHFGWLTFFAAKSCEATSEKTRQTLGWQPDHATLLEELVPGIYF